MYFLPRYFSIVFAFAGDSTTTKVFGASFFAVFAAVFFTAVFFAAGFLVADFFAAGFFTAVFFPAVFSSADVFAADVSAADFLTTDVFAAVFFTAVFFAASLFAAAVFAAPFPATAFPSFFSACSTASLFSFCGVFFCAVGKIAPPQILRYSNTLPLGAADIRAHGRLLDKPLDTQPQQEERDVRGLALQAADQLIQGKR